MLHKAIRTLIIIVVLFLGISALAQESTAEPMEDVVIASLQDISDIFVGLDVYGNTDAEAAYATFELTSLDANWVVNAGISSTPDQCNTAICNLYQWEREELQDTIISVLEMHTPSGRSQEIVHLRHDALATLLDIWQVTLEDFDPIYATYLPTVGEDNVWETKLAFRNFVLVLIGMSDYDTELTAEFPFPCLEMVTDQGFTVARPDFDSDEAALSFIYAARAVNPFGDVIEEYWQAQHGSGAKYFIMFGTSEQLNIEPFSQWLETKASNYERFHQHVNIAGTVRGGWYQDVYTSCEQDVVVLAINWTPESEETTIAMDVPLPTTAFSFEVQD